MSKPIVATISLAGCFGCHMSLLDIDEKIFDLVNLVEFHKGPLTDIKNFEKMCDIGIIEGGCCNTENIEVLEMFRRNCRVLISLGECAITGGLPSMRNGIPIMECLKEAYVDGIGLDLEESHEIPDDEELPKILDKVYPCHEIVKIDYFIPGCAPRAELIWEFLMAIIENRSPNIDYKYFKYD